MRNWLILVGVVAVAAVLALPVLPLVPLPTLPLPCAPGEVCFLCDSRGLEDVDHVELDPAEVYAGPGQQFQISAVPVLGNGLPVLGQGIPVTWAEVPFLQSQSSSTTASFSIPEEGLPQLISNISATVADGTTLAPGWVRIGSPDSTEAFTLEIRHLPGSAPEAVLVRPRQQSNEGACVVTGTTAMAMAGVAVLDDLVTGVCPPEIAVFMQGAAARLIEAVPVGDALTTPSFALQEPMEERHVLVEFDISRVTTTDTAAFLAGVAKAMELADHLFRTNRTGIKLVWKQVAFGGSDLSPGLDPCGSDTLLEQRLGVRVTTDAASDGYRLPDHTARVVYTNSMSDTQKGVHCARTPHRGPVIVISANKLQYTTTLTHELAHMFGLGGEQLPRHGHTDTPGSGFTAANILAGATSPCIGQSRNRLSLGQIYRMNFAADSWMRVRCQCEDSAETPDVNPTRACQYAIAEGICPALAADYPRRVP